MRNLLLIVVAALCACVPHVKPECSVSSIPVVVKETDIVYVKVDAELTKPVTDPGPAIPDPSKETTCGDALQSAKNREAALKVCNAKLESIQAIQGSRKNDG